MAKKWYETMEEGDEVISDEWNNMTDVIQTNDDEILTEVFTKVSIGSPYDIGTADTWTKLPLDEEIKDELGVFDLSNNQLEIQEGGDYIIHFESSADILKSDNYGQRVILNGGTPINSSSSSGPFHGGDIYLDDTILVELVNGDILHSEVICSTTPTTVDLNDYHTSFTVYRLR
mgnify:CR=1 FL=1